MTYSYIIDVPKGLENKDLIFDLIDNKAEREKIVDWGFKLMLGVSVYRNLKTGSLEKGNYLFIFNYRFWFNSTYRGRESKWEGSEEGNYR